MLVNHTDARADRIGRRVEHDRLAIDENLPLIRLIESVKLAHQRALARAILAQQGMDLARVHIEVDMIVSQHTRKAFDNAAHLQPLDANLWDSR